MSCNTIMSAPVCLIETDVNGLFCVRKEAKNILDGIKEPVVVVSVVGLYRTGKSYLMNRLAGQQSGFALGKTIESKTKGIWMWCVPHPTKPRHTLVLLDTEGLGDVDKGDEQHDTWIFCLALLLSSTLVYNSLGVIDNMALEKLHYVTELREHMLIKAGSWDEDGQNKSVFPAFVWTIRDFYLDLEKDNKPITADQYLEGALELKEGDSNNLARRCLRNFFVTRKCFVFPRPASPKDMKRMEVLTEAELDPEFLEQSKDFCKYIYHSAQSKTIAEGCVVTGKVLANLTEVYVEAIRSGSVPCLENAVISLSKIHNAQAVDEALQIYVKEIHKSLQLPVDSKQLSTFHKTFEKKAIEVFIRMSFNDTEQNYLKQLEKDIEAQYQAACVQNMEASRKVCQTILHDVFAPLEKSLSYNSYMKSGGYQEYRNTLTQLTRTYTSKAQMNMMSGEVLNNYLREKTQTEELVLQTDRNLTQALRQKEEERQRRLILEQKQREIETQRQRHQQMLVEKQRAHDEYMRQLEETRRREQKRIAEENQRIMEARLREQERMLQNSYQQETASLQRQLEIARNSIEYINSRDQNNCCIL